MKFAAIDLETTGLDYRQHQIWEFGIVLFDTLRGDLTKAETYRWFRYVEYINLPKADPSALRVGSFYSRHPRFAESHCATDLRIDENVAYDIVKILNGRTLVGSTITFDTVFLDKFVRDQGLQPSWHYRTVDAPTYASGVLGMRPGESSHTIAKDLGLTIPEDTHSALVDAMLAAQILQRAFLKAKDDEFPDQIYIKS